MNKIAMGAVLFLLFMSLAVITTAVTYVVVYGATRSTQENARLTAKIVTELAPRRVIVVSKQEHLDWAMPIFRKVDAFKTVEALACHVSRAESIAQMEEYLKTRDNARVRERLAQLRNGVKGTD